MSTEALQPMPCPWCGDAKPEFGFDSEYNDGQITEEHFVTCSNQSCVAFGPTCETLELAITAWNRVCSLAEAGAAAQGATEAFVADTDLPAAQAPR